ncbi:RHS repeat-associated core domain-containing protein [Pseudomonas sp. Marseille-P9899]|uniref:RHS repeat-associated core domain-containing protein n=1 Tax=Pseudomonas sp. Marseille-P9899 TaxID=2730401 RepID=UPI00158CAD4D|nr:RHS repeat-associated core domain-containing protein [Pseudomonas sp. Marseille-P9899]
MPKTLLIAPDVHNTPLAEVGRSALNPVLHTPYGVQSSDAPLAIRMGFNGQFRESQGWYCLGHGYRVFNPVLKRFHSPDRISPFGKGGINPYAYCQGDPVNHTDPTGQFVEWLGRNPLHSLGLNIALLMANLVTFIGSPPVGVALFSARMSLVGATLGIAGASMQIGGVQAGKAVSIAGTIGSLAGVSMRTGLGIQTLYQNRAILKEKAFTGMRQLFLGPPKVPASPDVSLQTLPTFAPPIDPVANVVNLRAAGGLTRSASLPTLNAPVSGTLISKAKFATRLSAPDVLRGKGQSGKYERWFELGI